MNPRNDLLYLIVVLVAAAGACLLVIRNGQTPPSALTVTPVSDTASTSSPLPASAASSSSPIASSTPAAFSFEIVSDPAAQEKGLGGRADVPENYGMLFVFPTDDYYGFWMKDMLVPIDIIWLSDNGTVLQVLDSVATSTYPTVFYPPEPVRYVLETRAGEAARQGWATGSTISIPLQN